MSSGYEVTMVIEPGMTTRLDALAARATELRKQAGKTGLIGLRDVLGQALATGVETLETHFDQASIRERLVLLPHEAATRPARVVATR